MKNLNRGNLLAAPSLPLRLSLLLVGYFTYLMLNEYQTRQYYDAEEYWNLASTFIRDKRFSLLNFYSELRGYGYPLLNVPFQALRKLGHLPLLTTVKLQGALWAALLFGAVLPATWQMLVKRRFQPSWGNWLALVAAGFLFWRDHFSFSLSDFPAYTILLVSLLLLVRRPQWWAWALAGAGVALTLNMRPVYVSCVPVVAILAGLLLRRSPPNRWARAAALATGFGLTLLPQLLINAQHSGKYTPLVISQAEVLGKRESLYEWHLAHGMRVQKFEVMVPPPGRYSLMGCVTDPAGKQLLVQTNNNQPFPKISAYLAQVGRHPLAFAALFGRHLFNGLDVRFASPYVLAAPGTTELDYSNLLLPFLNYTLLLLGALGLSRLPWQRNSLLKWVVAAQLVAIAAALPVIMESRFVLPLHMLLLMGATFGLPWVAAGRWVRRYPRSLLRLAPLYAAGVGLGLMLTTSTSALVVYGRYVMDIK